MAVDRCTCLCVGSKHWLRVRRRVLLGRERMALQGIMVQRHSATLKKFSEASLSMLSGNAINFFNFSEAFVAAVVAGAVLPAV